jgi:hypothetical protein
MFNKNDNFGSNFSNRIELVKQDKSLSSAHDDNQGGKRAEDPKGFNYSFNPKAVQNLYALVPYQSTISLYFSSLIPNTLEASV